MLDKLLNTETVRLWQQWAPDYVPLPNPSPRNTLWLRRNPWFESEMVPFIRQHVREVLKP